MDVEALAREAKIHHDMEKKKKKKKRSRDCSVRQLGYFQVITRIPRVQVE
jgi:hypothetical protein